MPERPQIELDVLSNFTHQVINPLNGVAGLLENLSRGVIVGEDRIKQRLIAARAQVEHAVTLLRNLAFLSAGFHRLGPTDTQIVVVPQVLIEAAQFFQELGFREGIRIELDNKWDQNKFYGSTDLIRQVFMNLFDNAVKYSEKNSLVKVHQWVQSKTNNVIVDVKSIPEGGVNKIDIERIFDSGYRGENAKSIIASGTGLGLYICKQIVEVSHGGKLEAFIDSGKWLVFRVRIPGGIENG